jgi:hypothetical protein
VWLGGEEDKDSHKDKVESLVHRIARKRRGNVNKAHGNVKAHVKKRRGSAKRVLAPHHLHMGRLDRVANLVEEVNDLVGSIGAIRVNEAAKSFANMALIADHLHHGFKQLFKQYREDFLLDEALSLHQLAEQTALTASALNKGTYSKGDAQLERQFKKSITSLLTNLELFSDLTEADDDSKDDRDDEDPDKKGSEDGDGDFDADDFDVKQKKMEAAEEDDDKEDDDDDDDKEDDDDDKEDDEDGKKKPFPQAAPPFGKKTESLLQRWGKRRKLYR